MAIEVDTVEIRIADLDELCQTLEACSNYFSSLDIQKAQLEYTAKRPSPLSIDVERSWQRFRGYLGDWLLAAHDLELTEASVDDEEVEEGAEDGSGELTEALSGSPLGRFTPPKQEGKRIA